MSLEISPSIEIIEPPPPDVVSVNSSIGDLQPLRQSTPRAEVANYATSAFGAFGAACQRNARARRLSHEQLVGAWRRMAAADRLAFHAEVLVGEESRSGAYADNETRVRDFFRRLNNRVG